MKVDDKVRVGGDLVVVTLRTKKEAQELFLSQVFKFQVNMNDTFGYACADVGEVSDLDYIDLLPIIQNYGYSAVIAYEAIRRGYAPLQPYINKDFNKAREQILKEMKEETPKDSLGKFPDLK